MMKLQTLYHEKEQKEFQANCLGVYTYRNAASESNQSQSDDRSSSCWNLDVLQVVNAMWG